MIDKAEILEKNFNFSRLDLSKNEIKIKESDILVEDEKKWAYRLDVFCKIKECKSIMCDPISCSSCEGNFCGDCLDKALKNDDKCPNCYEKFESRKIPNITMNFLNQIMVNCNYCKKFQTFRQLKSHLEICEKYKWKSQCKLCEETFEDYHDRKISLQHLNICPKLQTTCPVNTSCKMILKRKDFDHHVKNLCSYRIIKCQHCEIEFPYTEKNNHDAHDCYYQIQNKLNSIFNEKIKNINDELISSNLEKIQNNTNICDEKIKNMNVELILINHLKIQNLTNIFNSKIKSISDELILNNLKIQNLQEQLANSVGLSNKTTKSDSKEDFEREHQIPTDKKFSTIYRTGVKTIFKVEKQTKNKKQNYKLNKILQKKNLKILKLDKNKKSQKLYDFSIDLEDDCINKISIEKEENIEMHKQKKDKTIDKNILNHKQTKLSETISLIDIDIEMN